MRCFALYAVLAFVILPVTLGEEFDPADAYAWEGQSWAGDDGGAGDCALESDNDPNPKED